jgi:hypothetical protein
MNQMKYDCFNRIAKYLYENNSIYQLRIYNGKIQHNFDKTKYWLDMYSDLNNLNDELDCFIFGKDYIDGTRQYSSIFDYFLILAATSKTIEPCIQHIISLLYNKSCFEELTIKMDLMGI